MKKYFILFIFMIIFIVPSQVNSYASDDEVERTIDYLNTIRSQYDLPQYQLNMKLKNVALSHNKYMHYNSSFSSVEESGQLYYRGRYPWDRASYYQYDNPFVYEFISKTNNTYTEGIIQLLNNPYSRNILLDPVYKDIGMNAFEGLYTYELGGIKRDSDYYFIYPYNEQQNVPVQWENKYLINPYENLELKDTKVGIPITFTYYSDTNQIDNFTIEEFSLSKKLSGKQVDSKLVTPNDDRYLKNSIMILPKTALENQATYEINLKATIYFKNDYMKQINLTQTFTTEKKVNNLNQETLLTRGKFTEEIVKALGYTLLEPFEIKFHDIDIQSSDAKYIYTAYVKEIIKGVQGNYFRPELNITKEQTYAILIRAYEKKYGKITYNDFVDINDYYKVSPWFIEEQVIKKADKIGILIKDSNNNLNPQDYLTENEFKKIMEKYKEAIKITKN